MEDGAQIKAVQDYVQSVFESDVSGHDFHHLKRVAHLAKTIAIQENANVFITEIAALLHDSGDGKLFADPDESLRAMDDFLYSVGLTRGNIQLLQEIIKNISFRKGTIPVSLEGKIVQDADRLDAIGAIGIARTFAYGGANGQPIYHPQNVQTSIQHFYDKLLKLKDTMHTTEAKKLAEKRHTFLQNYLEQFWEEWQV